MMAGLVEPDCKPVGFDVSVALAARGRCILSGLFFLCSGRGNKAMWGASDDCDTVASSDANANFDRTIDCDSSWRLLSSLEKWKIEEIQPKVLFGGPRNQGNRWDLQVVLSTGLRSYKWKVLPEQVNRLLVK